MNMNLEVLKCPSCGANIEFEEGAPSCECEYCGAVVTISPNKDETPLKNVTQKAAQSFNIKQRKSKNPEEEGVVGKAIRKIFNALFIACLFFTGFAIIMLFVDTDAMGFGIVLFFAIYAAMFKVLSLTPKKSKHILGKPKGMKPVYFVLLSVLLSFAVMMTSATSSEDPNATDNSSNTSISTNISAE